MQTPSISQCSYQPLSKVQLNNLKNIYRVSEFSTGYGFWCQHEVCSVLFIFISWSYTEYMWQYINALDIYLFFLQRNRIIATITKHYCSWCIVQKAFVVIYIINRKIFSSVYYFGVFHENDLMCLQSATMIHTDGTEKKTGQTDNKICEKVIQKGCGR